MRTYEAYQTKSFLLTSTHKERNNEVWFLETDVSKTKEDFSPETRPWLLGLKSLRKMLKIRLVEGY